MAGQQVEMLQKLEKMGNLESVVTEQKIRIEKLRTTYETLKAEHLQLQDVSCAEPCLQGCCNVVTNNIVTSSCLVSFKSITTNIQYTICLKFKQITFSYKAVIWTITDSFFVPT